MNRALLRYSHDRVGRGLEYLIASQHADGLWRDYALIPGPSEAWSTAWIGWHLSHFSPRRNCELGVRRAATAILRARVPGGWGYNRDTGADADSTAWALRFLCRSSYRCGLNEAQGLSYAVDAEGRAHTFEGEQQGTWSAPHDDVTPIVGLALLACERRSEILKRLRNAVVRGQRDDGLWSSFWWASDAYASLWSVYFLRRSGGLSEELRARSRSGLSGTQVPSSALEAALWLTLTIELEHRDPVVENRLVHVLLETTTDRGWPGSPLLLVPRRFKEDVSSSPGPHADERGLMTTAAACLALTRWIFWAQR